MSDVKIECPHCRKSFKLNETLAAPLVAETRRKLEEEFGEKEEALEEHRKAFADELKAADKARKELERDRAALAKQKEAIDEEVAEQIKQQRAAIEREVAKKAKQKFDEKLAERDEEKAELEEQIKEKDEKLTEARKQEVEFRRKQRELDDKIKAADVDVEKRVAGALAPEREKAKKEAEEQQRLKMAEKDKIIDDQKLKLAEAQRKLEQGSQQLQGEVQEIDLEETLKGKFPHDNIEPVAKGVHGGDVLQRVNTPVGQECGAILWESKRTRDWNDAWLAKLRNDQRTAKAEIAIIVSEALPKNVSTFASIDGVLVVARSCVLPVAMLMRQQLIEINAARLAGEGQQTKMELLYRYLTGPEFRQRVEAIVEVFTSLHLGLAKERKAITALWATRQKQIDVAMQSTVGMWGELQGIAGKTLKEIEGLDIGLLQEGESGGDEME
jgi:hypothetical protein